jgi:hypothetical protein
MGAIAKSLTHAVEEVIAYAAEGVGQYLKDSRRDFMLRCVGALARKARLVGELIVSEKHLPYADRRQPADLERSVLPEIRALIAGGGVNVEAEVAQLNLSEWPGQEVASAILAILLLPEVKSWPRRIQAIVSLLGQALGNCSRSHKSE